MVRICSSSHMCWFVSTKFMLTGDPSDKKCMQQCSVAWRDDVVFGWLITWSKRDHHMNLFRFVIVPGIIGLRHIPLGLFCFESGFTCNVQKLKILRCQIQFRIKYWSTFDLEFLRSPLANIGEDHTFSALKRFCKLPINLESANDS